MKRLLMALVLLVCFCGVAYGGMFETWDQRQARHEREYNQQRVADELHAIHKEIERANQRWWLEQ